MIINKLSGFFTDVGVCNEHNHDVYFASLYRVDRGGFDSVLLREVPECASWFLVERQHAYLFWNKTALE